MTPSLVSSPANLLNSDIIGDYISGRDIVKEVGLVSASSVQTKSFFHDIAARIRGLFGGEVDFYSQLLNSANADACRRLQKEALKAGGDSVVSIKVQNSATSDPTAGVFVYATAYGTAVQTQPGSDRDAAPDVLKQAPDTANSQTSRSSPFAPRS